MKCDEIQQRLDDYLDGNLDTILVSMLEKHLTTCQSCATKVSYAESIQSELKQISSLSTEEIAISDAFISSAFAKVRAEYPEHGSSKRWSNIGIKTGFVTAVAAGFSLWAVLTTFILPGVTSNTVLDELAVNNIVVESAVKISTLNLTLDETRVVRIAIDTPDDFDKVTFSVILPKHIELKGHKNKSEISWDAKLAKGNNILRIPLKAIKYGQGNFIARITHNGKVKTFKLYLKSQKPDLSNIQFIELQV